MSKLESIVWYDAGEATSVYWQLGYLDPHYELQRAVKPGCHHNGRAMPVGTILVRKSNGAWSWADAYVCDTMLDLMALLIELKKAHAEPKLGE